MLNQPWLLEHFKRETASGWRGQAQTLRDGFNACNVLVVSKLERIREAPDALAVRVDGSLEKPQRLGCIARPPFLSGLFKVDAIYSELVT